MALDSETLDTKVHSMIERLLDIGLEARLDDARSLRIGLDTALEILALQANDEIEHIPQSDVVVIN